MPDDEQLRGVLSEKIVLATLTVPAEKGDRAALEESARLDTKVELLRKTLASLEMAAPVWDEFPLKVVFAIMASPLTCLIAPPLLTDASLLLNKHPTIETGPTSSAPPP